VLKKEFAIVDWGTSSFRLWVITPDGSVRSSYSGQAAKKSGRRE